MIRIVEIFSSIQGEGLYAGQKQIFVRFAGCNLSCDYCDQPEARALSSGRDWNPYEVKSEISRLSAAGDRKAVSFTGGEPLLQLEALRELMPFSRGLGLRVHLETNAVLASAFAEVSDFTDVVAADIKLPSATGRRTWDAHRRFLGLCPEKVFVKVVLTSSSRWEEWQTVVGIIKDISPNIPLFIQPATTVSGRDSTVIRPAGEEFIKEAVELAGKSISNVKVLPQQHPGWGVR